MSTARMRTVKKALELMRELDPDTAVSEYCLRGLIKSGKIPVIHAGRKVLVNVDMLMTYIAAGDEATEREPSQMGVIRRVAI